MFGPCPGGPKYIDPDDEELLLLRRQIVLFFIDMQYEIRAAMTKTNDGLREDIARELWTIDHLLPHVDPEIRRQILIDRKVYSMDPDFSFRAALNASENDDLS